MNYFEKIKKELKGESKLPLLLVAGMNNYFNYITNRDMTAGQFYLFICDFFDVINTWLKDQYGINHFLTEEINIQKKPCLNEIEKKLYYRYLNTPGRHNPVNSMIILGLIPYMKQLKTEENFDEIFDCINEINRYFSQEKFTEKVIKTALKNEILEKILKKEIA